MKKPAWSHSSLKDFEGCARRYHEVKVLKKYPFQETQATRYGNQVHESLELYVRDGKDIPPEHAQFKEVVDALLNKPGRKLAEQQMALDVELKPVDWFDKAVWVRGIADLLILNDDDLTAWVVDYKTGNNKYPDRDQLVLMSLLVFAHYPHIRKVNSSLLFLVKNDMVKHRMLREEVDAAWWRYRERTAKLEMSYASDNWNPTPSPLCNWCPCTGCELHPRH